MILQGPCPRCEKEEVLCVWRGYKQCVNCYCRKTQCKIDPNDQRKLEEAPFGLVVKPQVEVRRDFMLMLESKGWIPPDGYKQWFTDDCKYWFLI